MDATEFILTMTLVLGGMGMAFYGIASIRAYYMRKATPPAVDPQILAELDALRAEMAELHERMEFTERLVAQPREPGRLPGS